MFTDIVGYTKLMGEDEEKAFELLNKNRQVQRPIIERYNGRLLKEIGDGVLASFPTVSEAVYCAGTIQKACENEPDLTLRIGIHLGEVVFEGDDVFGDGVNIASRLEPLAPIGGILVSESVNRNLGNKKGIETTFVREEPLKNVKDPVKIYKVNVESVEKADPHVKDSRSVEIPAGQGAIRNRRKLIIGAVAMGLVTIAGWWYFQLNPPNGVDEQYSLGDSRIAILPYENNTNDPNLDVLGEMAADWIIQGLMSWDEIKVVSFETVQDHVQLASMSNLGMFAERTGAEKIVKGRYYLQGDELIFHSQLIDVESGVIELALPEVRGSSENVEGIVEDLRQRILTMFIAESDVGSESFRQTPPRYEAYEYFRRGWKIFGEDYDEALRLLGRAIQLDSNFYFAYGVAIPSYANQGKMKEADSVFQLAEKLVESLSGYDRLWREMFRAFVTRDIHDNYEAAKKIFEKDPRHWLANYHMGLYASRLNKPMEGIEYFSYIKPANISYDLFMETWWNRIYAYDLIRLERYEEAIDVLSYVPDNLTSNQHYDVLSIAYILHGDEALLGPMLAKMENENFSWEEITYRYIHIIRAYLLAKDHLKNKEWVQRTFQRIEEAEASGDKPRLLVKADANYFAKNYQTAIDLYKAASLSEPVAWLPRARMGCAYARLGMNETANRIITELGETITLGTQGHHEYGMAMIYAALGKKDHTVDLLKDGFEAGRGFNMYSYDLDPELLPLHGYPPYEEFVRPK